MSIYVVSYKILACPKNSLLDSIVCVRIKKKQINKYSGYMVLSAVLKFAIKK